jgi:hypothetical protein
MPPPKITVSWMSFCTICQLGGQANAELVCEWSNDVKLCTPTPTSPRKYHLPVSQQGAG